MVEPGAGDVGAVDFGLWGAPGATGLTALAGDGLFVAAPAAGPDVAGTTDLASVVGAGDPLAGLPDCGALAPAAPAAALPTARPASSARCTG